MSFLKKAKDAIARIVPKGFGDETLEEFDKQKNESIKYPSQEDEIIETSFNIEEDAYSSFMDEAPDHKIVNPGQKIKDVLEVLKIEETYELESDILLPEDFKHIQFEITAPSGFDTAQVEQFYEQARASVKRFVDLLKQRNEDIAKLATTVDRLEVDLNNHKFQSEIAEGINIMPTSPAQELEQELTSLKIQNARLSKELSQYKNKKKTSTPDDERLITSLQDRLSVLDREKEELEADNYELRKQLMLLQEKETDFSPSGEAKFVMIDGEDELDYLSTGDENENENTLASKYDNNNIDLLGDDLDLPAVDDDFDLPIADESEIYIDDLKNEKDPFADMLENMDNDDELDVNDWIK